MKSTPILMKDDMALAAHRGTKTQTRRPVKWHRADGAFCMVEMEDGSMWPYRSTDAETATVDLGKGDMEIPLDCPYGQAGDTLWVKETHYLYGRWIESGKTKTGRTKYLFHHTKNVVKFQDDPPLFICTKKSVTGWFKRNSLFMPRWASRTTMKITQIRVQRVNEISEGDAKAEGVEYSQGWEEQEGEGYTGGFGFLDYGSTEESFSFETAKESFKSLWDSINSGRGFGWKENPWTWAISFVRVKTHG